MENVFLIVGLGNPGDDYAKTRHNAGFLLVERLAAEWNADWKNERRFRAHIAKVEVAGQASSLPARRDATKGDSGRLEARPTLRRVLLCQPQTFMNSSGEAVGAVVNFYRLPLARILVMVDDADLPLGEVRLRPGGSSGGHHGLESVERHLGSREFARLRLGIGRRDGVREITDYVLSRFDRAEMALMKKVLDRAADQVERWLDAGIQQAMQLNGRLNELIE